VVAIDAAARRLNLDRPLTWHSGQGVALAFNGAAPDFGAYEADAPHPARSARGVLRLLADPAGWFASRDWSIVR
jgi:hypothetical protein